MTNFSCMGVTVKCQLYQNQGQCLVYAELVPPPVGFIHGFRVDELTSSSRVATRRRVEPGRSTSCDQSRLVEGFESTLAVRLVDQSRQVARLRKPWVYNVGVGFQVLNLTDETFVISKTVSSDLFSNKVSKHIYFWWHITYILLVVLN